MDLWMCASAGPGSGDTVQDGHGVWTPSEQDLQEEGPSLPQGVSMNWIHTG